MPTPLEELSVTYVENGVEKVRQIDKAVLSSSSSWATVAYLFHEVAADGAVGPSKVSVRRYRKKAGRYAVDKHFTLSSARQAVALREALARWFVDGAVDVVDAGDDDAG